MQRQTDLAQTRYAVRLPGLGMNHTHSAATRQTADRGHHLLLRLTPGIADRALGPRWRHAIDHDLVDRDAEGVERAYGVGRFGNRELLGEHHPVEPRPRAIQEQ